MNPAILVIGAMNLDILGTPSGKLVVKDSNIGRVRFAPGGVGRNVAEQLARRGIPVRLLTAAGAGPWAEYLNASLRALGIPLLSPVSAAEGPPVYLAIHDETGDMAAAVNDMSAMDLLTPDLVRAALKGMDGLSACVLEANLRGDTLAAAARSLAVPLVADPVSCEKALRLIPVLPLLTAIKPNLLEAEAMTGRAGPEEAARALLDGGVRQVYLSLGAAGLYYTSAEGEGFLPPFLPPSAACATGAGDAVTAGIAFGVSRGMGVRDCADLGLRFAADHLERAAEVLSETDQDKDGRKTHDKPSVSLD